MSSPLSIQRQAFCFTFNNYVPEDVDRIRVFATTPRVQYLIIGFEVGEQGTQHLQGFIQLKKSTRGSVVQRLISERVRIHIEPLKSTSEAAATYCKKDGAFTEWGTRLDCTGQGKRSDWSDYIEWVQGLGRLPTKREIILFNPSLFARYNRRCLDIAEAHLPTPSLVAGADCRPGWQDGLARLVQGDNHHPREIRFYVDEVGNSGKSWFTRWALSNHPDLVQVLKAGKRDDLAYAIDETKSIFLFDVPRTQMEFLNLSVLEMLKDQLVFSPKYESGMKVLMKTPMVVVFSNEEPDRTKMSVDRYKVIKIRQI